MSALHIHCVPTKVVRSESIGERWCFSCRSRSDFLYEVSVPIEEMSYYGPTPCVRCSKCKGVDGDLFPGRVREWDEE